MVVGLPRRPRRVTNLSHNEPMQHSLEDDLAGLAGVAIKSDQICLQILHEIKTVQGDVCTTWNYGLVSTSLRSYANCHGELLTVMDV
jgi:hypothetical protein